MFHPGKTLSHIESINFELILLYWHQSFIFLTCRTLWYVSSHYSECMACGYNFKINLILVTNKIIKLLVMMIHVELNHQKHC